MIKLTSRKGSQKSINIGFIGIGQGGGRIADSIAQIKMKTEVGELYQAYTVAAINTNPMDLEVLDNIKHKILLKGYEEGAGRVPDKGQEAFQQNQDQVVKELKRIFENVDRIMVIAGLGGGTGTGGFLPLAVAIEQDLNKPFNLLLTIPRKKESPIEKENAYDKYGLIQENLQYLSVALIDNEQLFLDYLENDKFSGDWLMGANEKISEVIHEVNLVTKAFKPFREKHFDTAEFINTLNVPGCITFGKTEVLLPSTAQDIVTSIKTSLEKGRLAGGFDFSKAKSIAISMVAPPHLADNTFDIKTLAEVEEAINNFTPKAIYRIIAPYVDPLMIDKQRGKTLLIYSVVSGMPLPENGRLAELVKEVEEFDNVQEDNLASNLSFNKKKASEPPKKTIGGLANALSTKKDEEETDSLATKFSFLKKKA